MQRTLWTCAALALLVIALPLGTASPARGAAPLPRASGPEWTEFQGDLSLTGIAQGGSPAGTTLYSVNVAKYLGGTLPNPLSNDYPYQSSPVTDGSSVYVALGNTLLSFSASNGAYQWQSNLPGGGGGGPVVGTPFVAGGMVFVNQDGGPNDLAAFYANNGTLAWSLQPPGGGSASSSSPVLANGNLVLTDTSGGFFLHPPSGTGPWTAPSVPTGASYFATASFGTISGVGPAWIIPDRGNRSLDAFSTAGVALPGFPMSGQPRLDRLFSSASLANLSTPGGGLDTWAFFGGEGGQGNPSHLYAVDVSHPSQVFALTLPAVGTGDSGIRSTPAVLASGSLASLIVGSRDGAVMRINFQAANPLSPTWQWGWNASAGGPVDASPVVVGSEVIVPSENGNVYSFGVGNGTQLWSVATGAPIYASPAVAGGLCWVVNSNGELLALGGNLPGGGNGVIPKGGASAISTLLILLAAVAAVVIATILVLWLHLRRRKPAQPSPTPPPPTQPSGATSGGR